MLQNAANTMMLESQKVATFDCAVIAQYGTCCCVLCIASCFLPAHATLERRPFSCSLCFSDGFFFACCCLKLQGPQLLKTRGMYCKLKCTLLLGRCWDQCFFPGLSMVELRFSPVLSLFLYSALGNVKTIIYYSHGIKVH